MSRKKNGPFDFLITLAVLPFVFVAWVINIIIEGLSDNT